MELEEELAGASFGCVRMPSGGGEGCFLEEKGCVVGCWMQDMFGCLCEMVSWCEWRVASVLVEGHYQIDTAYSYIYSSYVDSYTDSVFNFRLLYLGALAFCQPSRVHTYPQIE